MGASGEVQPAYVEAETNPHPHPNPNPNQVHQEKFNQPYVEAMGGYWKVCNARSAAEKAAWPHRECMAARMQDSREADATKARKTGTDPNPNSDY